MKEAGLNQSVTVSICIPSHNGANFLSNTLKNLFDNNYPRKQYEVIIANHGSTDKTTDILKKYCKLHPNLRVIDVPYVEENRSQPRNAILKIACGTIIIFIDQDILVSRDFISEHLQVLEKIFHKLSNII